MLASAVEYIVLSLMNSIMMTIFKSSFIIIFRGKKTQSDCSEGIGVSLNDSTGSDQESASTSVTFSLKYLGLPYYKKTKKQRTKIFSKQSVVGSYYGDGANKIHKNVF